MIPNPQPLRTIREVIDMENLTYKKILDAVSGKDISLVFEMKGNDFIMRMEEMPKPGKVIGVFDGIKSIA
jgi:hypothetical protein